MATSTAFILIGIGAGLSVLNWLCLFGSWLGKRHVSPVFPAPSILTAVGLALLDRTRAYCWVGLLTDYTFFALLIAAPKLATQAWQTSSFTRVQLLSATAPPRHFRLSLHRGGHFVLRASFTPPMPCNAHGACVNSFGAVGRWEEVPGGGLRLWGYWEERVLILETSGKGFSCREQHYPQNQEYPYDSLDGLTFQAAA